VSDHSPILSPPPKLVAQWIDAAIGSNYEDYIAAVAAQWGYDQHGAVNEAELQKARDEELKACLWHLESTRCNQIVITTLRAARRPKPPSLKEQALNDLDTIQTHDSFGFRIINLSNIRRALEALPND
jgi:hypothetical protein